MSGFGWVDDVLRSGYWQRGRRVEVQNLAAWTAGSSPDFVSIYWIRRRANSLPAAAKTFGFPICHPSAFQFLCFYQFSPSEWQCSQSFGFPPFGFPVTLPDTLCWPCGLFQGPKEGWWQGFFSAHFLKLSPINGTDDICPTFRAPPVT